MQHSELPREYPAQHERPTMFDTSIALAHSANLIPPSLTATPIAVASDDPARASALRTRLTAVHGLTLVDDPARARVLVWDAHSIEMEDGLPRLPISADTTVVVALTTDGDDPLPLLAAGVQGLVDRNASINRLRAAILAAELGLIILDEDPGDAIVAGWAPDETELVDGAPPAGQPVKLSAPAATTPAVPTLHAGFLTPREHEVLAELAEGLSNRAIGTQLGISTHTVKFHVDALLAKLEARSRTQAVVKAIRAGLLS